MSTIGTIGAGRIGTAIARFTTGTGHRVVLSNSRGPDSLRDLVAGLGDHVRAGTTAEAAAADVVVVTIPLGRLTELPRDLLDGRVVVDTMNHYPDRDGPLTDLLAPGGRRRTTSELTAEHLTGARVVKAFNNIIAHHLEQLPRPHGAADRSALPVAADDDAARAVVIGLLDDLGFDALDTGGLDRSWRFERGEPAYCLPYAADPAALLASAPGSRPEAARTATAADLADALARAVRDPR